MTKQSSHPLAHKTPQERRATEATLFLVGATLSVASIFLTRRMINRRRTAVIPQFFPSHARLEFPGRMQLEAAKVAAGVSESGGKYVATVVKTIKSDQAVEDTFLEGMMRPFMPLKAILPKNVGDWMDGIGKVSPKTASIVHKISTPAVDTQIISSNPVRISHTTSSTTPTQPHIEPLSLPLDSSEHLETLHLASINASLHPSLARRRADSSSMAAEALALATANVIAFAVLFAGGAAITLDIADLSDLKACAQRSIKKKEGVEDKAAEKELEEMAKEFLEKFKIETDTSQKSPDQTTPAQ